MRRRRGSFGDHQEEDMSKWEKTLASEGLGAIPDSVDSDKPTPTEFEETLEVASTQPSGDEQSDADDFPTLGIGVDEGVDSEDETVDEHEGDLHEYTTVVELDDNDI